MLFNCDGQVPKAASLCQPTAQSTRTSSRHHGNRGHAEQWRVQGDRRCHLSMLAQDGIKKLYAAPSRCEYNLRTMRAASRLECAILALVCSNVCGCSGSPPTNTCTSNSVGGGAAASNSCASGGAGTGGASGGASSGSQATGGGATGGAGTPASGGAAATGGSSQAAGGGCANNLAPVIQLAKSIVADADQNVTLSASVADDDPLGALTVSWVGSKGAPALSSTTALNPLVNLGACQGFDYVLTVTDTCAHTASAAVHVTSNGNGPYVSNSTCNAALQCGTLQNPYCAIQTGIDRTSTQQVLVAGSAGAYLENLVLRDQVDVLGGYEPTFAVPRHGKGGLRYRRVRATRWRARSTYQVCPGGTSHQRLLQSKSVNPGFNSAIRNFEAYRIGAPRRLLSSTHRGHCRWRSRARRRLPYGHKYLLQSARRRKPLADAELANGLTRSVLDNAGAPLLPTPDFVSAPSGSIVGNSSPTT